MNASGRVRGLVALGAAISLHALALAAWPNHDDVHRSEAVLQIVGLYNEVSSEAAKASTAARPVPEKVSRQAPEAHHPARPTEVTVKSHAVTKVATARTQDPAPASHNAAVRDNATTDTAARRVTDAKKAAAEAAADAAPADRVLPVDVYADIMAEMHYPRMAIRRGWQGEVALRLDVRDRTIRQVTMLASSGYQLLDDAAYRGIDQIRTLPLADGYYRLPVIFRLQ